MLVISRLKRDDSGLALASAIGMLAVGLVLTALIASTLVGGLTYTGVTRAGVQSQASAEAGVAAARAGLIEGTCSALGGVYESLPGESPEYFATVWVMPGSSWVRGCPTSPSVPVRILATGTAEASAPGAATAGNETTLEAVLGSLSVSTDLIPSGPAIYAYRADGFGGSGTLLSVDGSSPSVLVRIGDVACSGASGGVADWVIANGSLSISGSCSIAGNVWASNRVNMSGSVQVSGNVVGNGITNASSRILGNAWSTSDITLSGGGNHIAGNATAQTLTMNSSTWIGQNAWVRGATNAHSTARIQGRLTTQSLTGSPTTGSRSIIPAGPGASPYLTPPTPLVPEWVDFDFDMADWVGYTYRDLGTNCSTSAINSALAAIGTNKGVIDGRNCTNGFNLGGNDKFEVRNDLALVANRFDLGGSAGFTATGSSPRELRLIVPDISSNREPDCPTNGRFVIGGNVTFATQLSTMIYTPCRAEIASGLRIKGQLYTGLVSVGGNAQIAYDPVGLPGVNLSTGETGGGGGSEADRVLESLRVVRESN